MRNKILAVLVIMTVLGPGIGLMNIQSIPMAYIDKISKGELELETSVYNWTTIEVVSTESTNDSDVPSIAVDSFGNVHVAWQDWTDYGGSGTDFDIFYKCWNATSSSWTTTKVVSTESTNDSDEPTIAVDDSGNVHVAWEDYTDYENAGTDCDIFYKCWNATTSTWSGYVNTTDVVSTESTADSWYPTIAVDTSGNVHVAWEDCTIYGGSGMDQDIFYKCWNATTRTWSGFINDTDVVSTESTGITWESSIAVDGSGNVHVAWTDWTNYPYSGSDFDIVYKRWNATTSTWSGYVNTTDVVSTESMSGSEVPSIAVDGSGNVHVTWYDDPGPYHDIFYKRWNATSSSWTTTEEVSTESTNDSYYTTIAVDGSDNVHVAWFDRTDYGGSGTDFDIFYKRWNATTGSWTTTEVVSTESTNDSRWLAIAVDSSGNVHVAWTDWTDYGGSGTDWDIFYKRQSNIPTSYNPDDIITLISGSETIDWILWDAVGSGKYRVWANDTNDNYYIWRDWTDWTHNTNLQVPINRTAVGIFNYTIEYNNSNGIFGIPDTVIVNITQPSPTPEEPTPPIGLLSLLLMPQPTDMVLFIIIGAVVGASVVVVVVVIVKRQR